MDIQVTGGPRCHRKLLRIVKVDLNPSDGCVWNVSTLDLITGAHCDRGTDVWVREVVARDMLGINRDTLRATAVTRHRQTVLTVGTLPAIERWPSECLR